MRIRYELQTPWPTDVRNPDGFDAIDWIKLGEIPFVPFAGLMIDSGDGDLREAKQVYWSVEEPDLVSVYFDDEGKRPLKYWTEGGWESNDLPKKPERKVRKQGAPA